MDFKTGSYNYGTSGAGMTKTKVMFPELKKAVEKQVAGTHYKKYVIQPVEFITKNDIPYIEGNIIKYICRWKDKGGVEDLDKVIHYVELLKELKT